MNFPKKKSRTIQSIHYGKTMKSTYSFVPRTPTSIVSSFREIKNIKA